MIDDREAILARSSRRRYLPASLDAQTDARIRDLVLAANRAGGLFLSYVKDRPDLFGGFRKTYGLLSGVRNFLVLAGGKSDPDAAEKCGYYGERIVLELTKLGLGTCWVGGSFDRERVQTLLAPGVTLFAVIALGTVAPDPSPRERLVRFSTHLGKAGEGRFHRTDGTEPDWFFEAVARLALAPSAVNRRPVFLNVEHGVVSAVLRIRDATAPIDLGIAKLHVSTVRPDGVWRWGDGGIFLIP